jgi:hypothetical protein
MADRKRRLRTGIGNRNLVTASSRCKENSTGRYDGLGMVIMPFVPIILVAGPTAPSSIRSDVLVTDDVVIATAWHGQLYPKGGSSDMAYLCPM